MRKSIIDYLKSSKGSFISGEEIAKKLGISRAAVWKHIQQLRKTGYKILSSEHSGYKLQVAPDLLLPSEIQAGLKSEIIGKRISYHITTDSTNRIAKALANEGAEDGTIVIAEEQTGGKGRLGRSFFSPKYKSILMSILLKPAFLPHEAPKCTLMAAVAVANTMREFDLRPEIKWPNDILYDGRKVVGILTEISAEIEKINYIVIGTGINVNIERDEFPEELRDIAASLSEMKGDKVPRIDFLRVLLEEFDKLYIEAKQQGFAEILNQWRKYNITLGKSIKVIPAGGGEEFTAVAEDIDDEGALIVKTSKGVEKVYAGDVSIRDRSIN